MTHQSAFNKRPPTMLHQSAIGTGLTLDIVHIVINLPIEFVRTTLWWTARTAERFERPTITCRGWAILTRHLQLWAMMYLLINYLQRCTDANLTCKMAIFGVRLQPGFPIWLSSWRLSTQLDSLLPNTTSANKTNSSAKQVPDRWSCWVHHFGRTLAPVSEIKGYNIKV